jgi:hypothetical protein
LLTGLRSLWSRFKLQTTCGTGKHVDNSHIPRNGLHVIFTPEGRSQQWPANPIYEYADERNRVVERVRVSVERGDDPATVAAAVLQAATKREPTTKTLVGRGARQLRVLRTLLPRTVFEFGLRRQFGLSDPPKQ